MKTTTPKDKPIRTRRMWIDRDDELYLNPCGPARPVAVIDVSQPEKLVEQAGKALRDFPPCFHLSDLQLNGAARELRDTILSKKP